MVIKILFIILVSQSLVFAKDCGAKPGAKANSIWVYEKCPDSAKKCLTLINRSWKFSNLLPTPWMSLDIKEAEIHKDKSGQHVLKIKQSKESACWFKKLTKKNLKKNLFFVVRGEIIASAEVHSVMSENVSIPMKKEWPSTELKDFCRWIHKDCKTN